MQEVLRILLPLVILFGSFYVIDGALIIFGWLGNRILSAVQDYIS